MSARFTDMMGAASRASGSSPDSDVGGLSLFSLRRTSHWPVKTSEAPDVAFTEPAPLAGGTVRHVAGGKDAVAREPRVRDPETDALETNARLARRQDVREAHGRCTVRGRSSRRNDGCLCRLSKRSRLESGRRVAESAAAMDAELPDLRAKRRC